MDQAQSTVGSGGIWYELNKYGSPVPAYVNLEQNIYSETRPKSGIIQSLPEDFLFEVLEEATQKLLYFDPSTSVAFPDKPPNTLIIPAALSKDFLFSKLGSNEYLPVLAEIPANLLRVNSLSEGPTSISYEKDSVYTTQSEPVVSEQASSDNVDALARLGSLNKGGSVSLPNNAFFTSRQCILNGYAMNFFTKARKGFLWRKPVPLEDLTSWTSSPIGKPLIILPPEHHKAAIKCFKILQKLMGDKNANQRPMSLASDGYEDLKFILKLAHTVSELADELYCQLCKQIYKNPSFESLQTGWKILSVYVNTFAPSNNLLPYIFRIIEQSFDVNGLRSLSRYCHKKLTRLSIHGSKTQLPSAKEISRYMEAPYYTGYFEESLKDIMESDRMKDPDCKVPLIFSFLTNALFNLRATEAEGIFRIPGDAEAIGSAKLILDRGQFNEVEFRDPSVPASLLKMWFRELEEPLIPYEYYEACLAQSNNWDQLSKVLQELPEDNKNLINELVRFLRKFLTPESIDKTKMTIESISVILAPSFLRCPSNDPLVIIKNSKCQQSFVKELLRHPPA